MYKICVEMTWIRLTPLSFSPGGCTQSYFNANFIIFMPSSSFLMPSSSSLIPNRIPLRASGTDLAPAHDAQSPTPSHCLPTAQRKFIIFNAQFLVFNAQFSLFQYEFMILTHFLGFPQKLAENPSPLAPRPLLHLQIAKLSTIFR